MDAVVPAAGKGTRLRPRTDDKPKGLVEVAERPLLSYVFDRLIESSVTDFYVVVGYKADQIIREFGDTYNGVPITYIHQREQQGLGHAILQAESHLRSSNEPFVVLNGDNIFGGTIQDPVTVGRQPDVDVVIGVETADQQTAQQTGVVVTDEDGRVTNVVEKPTDPSSTQITTGCYVLPTEIFPALRLVQPSDRGEIELADAVDLLISARMHVQAVPIEGPRVNVNTPEDITRAEKILQELG